MKNSKKMFIEKTLKVNAVVIPIILAALALNDFYKFVGQHLRIVEIILVCTEIVIIAGVKLSENLGSVDLAEHLLTNYSKKIKTTMRFANADDLPGVIRVYNSSFDPNMTMIHSDFKSLMARGCLIRVIEETFLSGNERTTKIAGYYSIFPLREREFSLIKQGKLKEEALKPIDIPALNYEKVKALYLSEICISPGSDAGTMLIRDMLRYLPYILSKQKNIVCVAGWPSTATGKKLAEQYGLQRCCSIFRRRRIYSIDREAALSSQSSRSGVFKTRWSVSV